MSRSKLLALKWIFLLASVALLVLSAVEVWGTAERVMWIMHRYKWSQYLHRSPSFPLGWILACQWDRQCSRVFNGAWWKLYPKWMPVAFVACLYGAGIVRILAERAREKSRVLPGAARWADRRKELRHLIHGERGSPQRGYVGLLAPERVGIFGSDPVVLRLPERIRCAHCMVVGGPGARKTTGYHKMNLLGDAVDGVSAVVFDLKYPDPVSGFLDCVPFFARKGFDVQLFLPFEEETLALPLIAGVTTVEEAYDVVDVLRPESGREHSGTWFLRQERELLTALVLGVATDHLRADDDPYRGRASLRRLYLLCKGGVREVERYVHTHPNPEVRRMAAGLFDLREDTLAGTIAGIAGALHIFNDEVLDRNTSSREDAGEEVDLRAIGERPCLLYVGIPQEKVMGRGQVLVQLVKRVVERELLRTADRHGGTCPQHVSIYIDEFRAMGPLPNVSEMMATMRSRRVCYHLSLQNRAQGEELYGPLGFRSFFVNNVQTVIIFPRYLKFDDAQYFSEALGYMTMEQRSTGHTHRMFEMLGGSRTEWYRDVLRPLVPPEEYADWPDGVGILFTTGVRPVRVLLPRLDEDRIMNVRNPFAGLRDEHVAPFTAVLRTREGRQRVISWLMAHHRAVSGVRGAPRPREAEAERSEGVGGEGRAAASPAGAAAGGGPVPAAQERRPEAQREHAAPPPPPASGATAGEAEGQLKRWAGAVAGLSLPDGAVRAYFHNRRMTKLSIHRAALPQELSAPSGLLDWMARGWVRVTPSEIALLPRGFQVVGRELLGGLRRKASAGGSREAAGPGATAGPAPGGGRAATEDAGAPAPVPAPEGLAMSSGGSPEESPEERALRAVAEWVERNGAALEGHPARSDGGEPVGVWKEGEFVALLPSVVASILEEAGIPLEQQQVVKERWRDANHLRTDAGHVTLKVNLAGQRRRMLVFNWQIFAGRRASA